MGGRETLGWAGRFAETACLHCTQPLPEPVTAHVATASSWSRLTWRMRTHTFFLWPVEAVNSLFLLLCMPRNSSARTFWHARVSDALRRLRTVAELPTHARACGWHR